MNNRSVVRVAIVGFGPRGLGALESLARAAVETEVPVMVDIFEPGQWPAAGPNFSPDESDVCLLNLPLREIDLPPAFDDGICGFAAWLGKTGHDRDSYVPRARLGEYLVARFQALLARLPAHVQVTLHRQRIENARRDGDYWKLCAKDGACHDFHHVLLSLGQPATRPDRQLEQWRSHATGNGLSLSSSYPGAALIAAAADWAGRNVGIRGMALSALDVVRLLSVGLGGRFEDGRYLPSGREPARIVPFSLDGHAPAPKPASATLDETFDPLPGENEAFVIALRETLQNGTEDLSPILRALAEASVRVIDRLGGDAPRDIVDAWLRTEITSPGAQEKRSTTAALAANIAQAGGSVRPEIGYVIGQIWRKWQPQLRSVYDRTSVPPSTAKALTGFDEGLKRYSYGAPAESARQFLALIEAGLVEPRAADDPDIRLVPDGWEIRSGDQLQTVSVMIDSVLPAPVLERVDEPLIRDLQRSVNLHPLGEGLGARCDANASVISIGGHAEPGLWLIGRLANGSVIAEDSIHDCFSATNSAWAQAVIATPIRWQAEA